MRRVFSLFAVMAIALFVWTTVEANDQDKEVTIKGKVTCAKCDLAKETKCMTVIVEKKDDKEAIYYFDTEGHKKWHSDICSAGKDGTVTGMVADKDGKKTVTVKDVKYEK